MSGEAKEPNPGQSLRDQAAAIINSVRPCDYLTVKHDGYTVTVSKDEPTNAVKGFSEGTP